MFLYLIFCSDLFFARRSGEEGRGMGVPNKAGRLITRHDRLRSEIAERMRLCAEAADLKGLGRNTVEARLVLRECNLERENITLLIDGPHEFVNFPRLPIWGFFSLTEWMPSYRQNARLQR